MDDKEKTLLTWLTNAHAMEVNAIKMLEGHAEDADEYTDVRQKIEEHVAQTRSQADRLEECIESLGGSVSEIKEGLGAMMGALQGVAADVYQDKVIKNALGDFAAENFEIASYTSLIAAAEHVGNDEVARVCKEILKEEESMAEWLKSNISPLTKRFLESAE